MKKSIAMLDKDFESSSGLTVEFMNFYKTFKKEFTEELKTTGATNIVVNRGHFYISGFFTVREQPFYFSISDVRGSSFEANHQLMYRKVKDYKDFSGGLNQYVKIERGMAQNMAVR